MSSFDGLDITRLAELLDDFVAQTKPKSLSSGMVITAQSVPTCGRAQALALSEKVRPILDALSPGWREDNAINRNFEFQTIRDACARLAARMRSHEEVSALLSGHDAAPQLSASRLHEVVWGAASVQWSTGHRHEAVLAASKAVNSMLQYKLNRRDLSDTKLLTEAFSEKPPEPERSRLRFDHIEDDQTRESVRVGVSSFGVGCFRAIRNPVGHLPNAEHELSEQAALERLAAFSLLARWIDESNVEATGP